MLILCSVRGPRNQSKCYYWVLTLIIILPRLCDFLLFCEMSSPWCRRFSHTQMMISAEHCGLPWAGPCCSCCAVLSGILSTNPCFLTSLSSALVASASHVYASLCSLLIVIGWDASVFFLSSRASLTLFYLMS